MKLVITYKHGIIYVCIQATRIDDKRPMKVSHRHLPKSFVDSIKKICQLRKNGIFQLIEYQLCTI